MFQTRAALLFGFCGNKKTFNLGDLAWYRSWTPGARFFFTYVWISLNLFKHLNYVYFKYATLSMWGFSPTLNLSVVAIFTSSSSYSASRVSVSLTSPYTKGKQNIAEWVYIIVTCYIQGLNKGNSHNPSIIAIPFRCGRWDLKPST